MSSKTRQRWRSVEDLRPHLEPIILDLGRMPRWPELLRMDRSDLLGAMTKFGGFYAVAVALGFEDKAKPPTKLWRSIEDFHLYLDPIANELGRMPTCAELKSRDLGGAIGAIRRFGGWATVARLLGYRHHGRQAWTPDRSVEDLRLELTPLVLELGAMPTFHDLTQKERSDLIVAIQHHGGFGAVATALGFSRAKPNSGNLRWRSVEDLRPHLAPIVFEIGRMPTLQELELKHRIDLKGAIAKFGGIFAVAMALGFTRTSLKTGPKPRWRSVEDLRPYLDPLVADLDRMPTGTELEKRKLHGLSKAITKFGGYPAVAGVLGYSYSDRPSWPSVEALRSHLDPMVTELGHMPTYGELTARGRQSLRNPIHKFGGANSVALQLGYQNSGWRSWSSVEDLRSHLDPVVAELGRMPNSDDLLSRDRGYLIGVIRKFGGYPAVARQLNIPYRTQGEQQSAKLAARLASGAAYKPSRLESGAAPLLESLGFRHQSIRREAHYFDYGDVERGLAVEINGCYWHDHRAIKPSCPVRLRVGGRNERPRFEDDERTRRLAEREGLLLLELWGCEQASWAEQIEAWTERREVKSRSSLA